MSDHLKAVERERKLEKIRGKKRRKPSAHEQKRRKDTGVWRTLHNLESAISLEAREAGTGALSREGLRAQGYRPVAKYTDLAEHGYQIVEWFSPRLHTEGRSAVVYEYAPSVHKQKHNVGAELPRLVATTIEEQQAIHRALGVRDSDVCDTQQELF